MTSSEPTPLASLPSPRLPPSASRFCVRLRPGWQQSWLGAGGVAHTPEMARERVLVTPGGKEMEMEPA